MALLARAMLESAPAKVKSKFEFHFMKPRRGSAVRSRYNVRTPARIVDVAARLFAEQGYAAVSLKDIVKAAKVNGASVHYHFGDKRNLYRRVIEESLAAREQAVPLEGGGEGRPPQERLRAFVHALTTQLLDDSVPSLMSRLMLREAIEPTAVFDRAVDELPRRQLRILDGIIRGMVGKDMPRGTVRRMSISVLGQCVYYRYAEQMLRRIDPRLRYTKRSIDSIAEHIYAFSLAAIKGMGTR
jgi:TetR/AcrR family transcriptional regulator, regulator of cefoperazone and chloramphenicol sensitivity